MVHNLFSGTGFLTREGKPAIIYHGEGSGRNQIAFAEDDLLERWSKPVPVNPMTKSGALPEMRHWDPDCWLDGDTYYAISGGKDPHWMKSADLRNWEYLGRLLHDQMPVLDVPRDEDISCPNMFRIGDKWMLLCLSHWIGSRYYLGRFQDEKSLQESHGRMNWMCAFQGGGEDADVYAPESLLTPDGRRVMWAWSRIKHRLKDVPVQSSIQCLPRELSLPTDGVLRIKPLRELEQLRQEERSAGGMTIPADASHRLENIAGDTLELSITFQPGAARKFGVHAYCDQDGRNGFPITYEPEAKMLTMGGRYKSRLHCRRQKLSICASSSTKASSRSSPTTGWPRWPPIATPRGISVSASSAKAIRSACRKSKAGNCDPSIWRPNRLWTNSNE